MTMPPIINPQFGVLPDAEYRYRYAIVKTDNKFYALITPGRYLASVSMFTADAATLQFPDRQKALLYTDVEIQAVDTFLDGFVSSGINTLMVCGWNRGVVALLNALKVDRYSIETNMIVTSEGTSGNQARYSGKAGFDIVNKMYDPMRHDVDIFLRPKKSP